MKTISHLAVLIACFFVLSAQAGQSIEPTELLPAMQSSIERCERFVPEIDTIACPRFELYIADGKITSATLAYLFSNRSIEPVEKHGQDAVKAREAILDSFSYQLATTNKKAEARDIYRSVKTLILGFKATRVFYDPRTYWAQSVNSHTLVLVDDASGLVLVVEHGDTDG